MWKSLYARKCVRNRTLRRELAHTPAATQESAWSGSKMTMTRRQCQGDNKVGAWRRISHHRNHCTGVLCCGVCHNNNARCVWYDIRIQYTIYVQRILCILLQPPLPLLPNLTCACKVGGMCTQARACGFYCVRCVYDFFMRTVLWLVDPAAYKVNASSRETDLFRLLFVP